MSIEHLQIDNFQAHSKQRYAIHRRLTTIVGPSDSGKSAVIRALGWISMNRPRGESFIKQGSTEARALVVLDGGRKIGRRRGKSINEYRLDAETIKAFGSEVPEQVSDLLAIDPELNFQQQHDPPFWVGLSAPELARQLNRVVDLDVIDRVAQRLGQRARKSRDQLQLLEEELKAVQGKLDRVSEVPRLESLLKEHDGAQEHFRLLADNADLLADLVARLENVRAEFQPALRVSELGSIAVGLVKEHMELVSREASLASVIEAHETAPCPPPGGWIDVEKLRKRAVEARSQHAELLDSLARLEEAERSVERASSGLRQAQQEMSETSPGRCPYCNQKIKD